MLTAGIDMGTSTADIVSGVDDNADRQPSDGETNIAAAHNNQDDERDPNGNAHQNGSFVRSCRV
jgi:hypothetical protein